MLKLESLKTRLRKKENRILATEAKLLRSKYEANQDRSGDLAPVTAQESKKLDESASDKGITALENAGIIKHEGTDPPVTQVPTPPVQEGQSIYDGKTTQGHAKPESGDGKEVVSSILTHRTLISSSQPSLPTFAARC